MVSGPSTHQRAIPIAPCPFMGGSDAQNRAMIPAADTCGPKWETPKACMQCWGLINALPNSTCLAPTWLGLAGEGALPGPPCL